VLLQCQMHPELYIAYLSMLSIYILKYFYKWEKITKRSIKKQLKEKIENCIAVTETGECDSLLARAPRLALPPRPRPLCPPRLPLPLTGLLGTGSTVSGSSSRSGGGTYARDFWLSSNTLSNYTQVICYSVECLRLSRLSTQYVDRSFNIIKWGFQYTVYSPTASYILQTKT